MSFLRIFPGRTALIVLVLDFDDKYKYYNLYLPFLAFHHGCRFPVQVWICVDSEKDHRLAKETPEMKPIVFTPQEKNRALLK